MKLSREGDLFLRQRLFERYHEVDGFGCFEGGSINRVRAFSNVQTRFRQGGHMQRAVIHVSRVGLRRMTKKFCGYDRIPSFLPDPAPIVAEQCRRNGFPALT
jgi:hypothetical protein